MLYPPRNGADIYVERLARHLSIYRGASYVLASNMGILYESGKLIESKPVNNDSRSKNSASLRTLGFRSHYFVEKFLSQKYIKLASKILVDPKESGSLVICSFIFCASLLEDLVLEKRPVVLTHNDELTWFRNQRRFTANPLKKMVARFSEKWVLRFLKKHEQDYLFIHISENDYSSYLSILPDHRALIMPAGSDSLGTLLSSPGNGKVRLLFCGSLNVDMNLDALCYFKDRYWPVLRRRLKDSLEIWIAGSRPGAPVRRLCATNDWRLFADLTDAQLLRIRQEATFGILPFRYTTGAKIKLLDSLSAGLPVMATRNLLHAQEQEFPPNLYDDSPEAWLEHILRYKDYGPTNNQRAACQQYASRYSWQNIVEKFNRELSEMRL